MLYVIRLIRFLGFFIGIILIYCATTGIIDKNSSFSFGEWLPFGFLGLLLVLPYKYLRTFFLGVLINILYIWSGGIIGYKWMEAFIYGFKYPPIQKWSLYLYPLLCIVIVLNWISSIFIMTNIKKKMPSLASGK